MRSWFHLNMIVNELAIDIQPLILKFRRIYGGWQHVAQNINACFRIAADQLPVIVKLECLIICICRCQERFIG